MKKIIYCLLSCLLWSSFALADGTESGGGANPLIASFVKIASTVLSKVYFQPEHRILLAKALAESKIVTVKVLMDPATGKPVANQEKLVAYSSKNLIQLKEKPSSEADASWEVSLLRDDPLAYIVIHELWRASGIVSKENRSPDDTFQLSIGLYRLDRLNNDGEISTNVTADMTCIGKIGELNTRLNFFNDGLDIVEITQEGDFPYVGMFTVNKQGVRMGVAASREGHKIEFDIELSYQQRKKAVTANLGVQNERGNVSGGTLWCITL